MKELSKLYGFVYMTQLIMKSIYFFLQILYVFVC